MSEAHRPFSLGQVPRAKLAYSTRRVDLGAVRTLVVGAARPRPGDLVLARVIALGQHAKLELRDGRRAQLFVGDEVIVAYGDRYAPDQFEAEVCADLRACHLVAAGGLAACMVSRHNRMRPPTQLQPLGLLGDAASEPLNLDRFALPARAPDGRATVLAVLGTSMNAGKTLTAASLAHGLRAAGRRVGAAKVTGTGAGGDRWLMADAGADPVLDFVDAGLASTYRAAPATVEAVLATLVAHLERAGAEQVVLEVADGLCQRETAALLASPAFAATVDGVLFAAQDAMGAAMGASRLADAGLPVAAVGGALAASPLARREAAAVTGLPVLGPEDLATAEVAVRILDAVRGRRSRRQLAHAA